MSAPGPRSAADINLDEFERRLRAAGALQASTEDPLSELARLVESARVSVHGPASSARLASRSAPPEQRVAPPVATSALRPSVDDSSGLAGKEAETEIEGPQVPEADAEGPLEIEPAAQMDERRPRGFAVWVPALALAGVAMIGAVFWLKGGVPGLPRQPPFIAAAPGPTKVQPPSDETVGAPNDAGASLLRDSSKPASVKMVNSEEQPVDLSAQASLGNPAPPAPSPSPAPVPAQPPAGALSGTPVAATVDTPVVPPSPAVASPPAPSQFPDPKPVRTVSLRPDGSPIPQPSVESPVDYPPPKAPAKPAPKATSDVAGVAQSSTPKLELPTKLSGKSSARVLVAKTDTTAPDAAGETPSQLTPKSEKAVKKPKTEPTGVETAVAPQASVAPPVEPTAAAAAASGGWAVQLAAPKTEAEAKSDVARLNAKYSADLNGAAIGVHKAVVNGEAIYRLRVVGLTKADAAALCARVKGDGGDCFIAK